MFREHFFTKVHEDNLNSIVNDSASEGWEFSDLWVLDPAAAGRGGQNLTTYGYHFLVHLTRRVGVDVPGVPPRITPMSNEVAHRVTEAVEKVERVRGNRGKAA